MSDPVQEQLLGYVLGALDDSERQALEDRLRSDARLQSELTRIRRRLRRLRSKLGGAPPPPPGLTRRTCDFVFQEVDLSAAVEQPALAASSAERPVPALPVAAGSAAPGYWLAGSWPDVAVTVGVLMTAALLIFPALQRARTHSQTLACQDNLRELGIALESYSRQHEGFFPYVPVEGRLAAAGIYAPILLRDGLLAENRMVVCPGSELAGNQSGFRVPTWEELTTAREDAMPGLRTAMGGSYGYCLGYLDHGQYRGHRNLQRPQFALVADAPSHDAAPVSRQHGALGQNVLFEDGHARFAASTRPDDGDDIYLNDEGLAAAGVSEQDAVIVASDTAPLPQTHALAGLGAKGRCRSGRHG